MELLVGDLLASAAIVDPQGIAATLGERHVTFAQLDAAADRLAAALVAAGVRRGDIVAWWSTPAAPLPFPASRCSAERDWAT